MKVFWLQIAGLLILIFGALYITAHRGLIQQLPPPFTNSIPSVQVFPQYQIKIVDGEFPDRIKASLIIETADTPGKRSKGLGNRESLATNSGMLFILDQKQVPDFWMKGMTFPLDFIWIDDNRIIDLLSNVDPPQAGQSDETLPRLAPVAKVDKVLEVNANFISENKITLGDKIQFINPK